MTTGTSATVCAIITCGRPAEGTWGGRPHCVTHLLQNQAAIESRTVVVPAPSRSAASMSDEKQTLINDAISSTIGLCAVTTWDEAWCVSHRRRIHDGRCALWVQAQDAVEAAINAVDPIIRREQDRQWVAGPGVSLVVEQQAHRVGLTAALAVLDAVAREVIELAASGGDAETIQRVLRIVNAMRSSR